MASCSAHVLRSSITEISIIIPAVVYWIFAVFHKLSAIITITLQSTYHYSVNNIPYIWNQGLLIPKLCSFYCCYFILFFTLSPISLCLLFLCLRIFSSCILQYWTWELFSSKYPVEYHLTCPNLFYMPLLGFHLHPLLLSNIVKYHENTFLFLFLYPCLPFSERVLSLQG